MTTDFRSHGWMYTVKEYSIGGISEKGFLLAIVALIS